MRARQARRAVAGTIVLLVALTAAGTRADAHQPAPHDPRQFATHIAMCSAEPEGCRPPPRPKSRPSRGGGRTVTGGDVWAKLALCENGGRTTSDPGDRYRGAFQFAQSTWESVGGTGDPAAATYERQLELAQRLQARSGWGQWPRCSKRLGLR